MSDFHITITGARELVARLEGAAGGGFSGRAVVGTNLNYAKYVSFGTRPHRIAAHGRALNWPGAAHPVRAVNHPGTRANPYVEQAAEASIGPLVALLQARITELVAGGGGSFRQAFAQGGMLVQANVQRGAPVKTGTLRRSWHTEVM